MGYVDHGRGGSGEPVVVVLRPGYAGSNAAADHIGATRLALDQILKRLWRGRQTLIRAHSGGGTREFVAWLAQRRRWLSYSVGMTITDAITRPSSRSWPRPGHPPWNPTATSATAPAWPNSPATAGRRPKGLRLIVRKKRPHSGAQLCFSFTDADGMIIRIDPDLLAWRPLLALTG